MAANKTSLSAGEIIGSVLAENKEVTALAKRIYPVVSEPGNLPYIVYRRAGMEQQPVKRRPGSDTISVEVLCCAAAYAQSIELAEAVRGALDGVQILAEGLTMRSCLLADSEESWQNDAFVQQLIFAIKI